MTINYARESVIDFTKPFMNLGIGILFKVPALFCVVMGGYYVSEFGNPTESSFFLYKTNNQD
jgi:hypothetical protein